jgi:hypothetical protein
MERKKMSSVSWNSLVRMKIVRSTFIFAHWIMKFFLAKKIALGLEISKNFKINNG